MTCLFCEQAIEPGQPTNFHHTIYKSRGGTETAPSHKDCHKAFHSSQGDFREFGRRGGLQSAITGRWSFNLRGVKDHPAYADTRAYYRSLYAHQ